MIEIMAMEGCCLCQEFPAYVMMQQYTKHVQYQLPNEHSIVRYLLAGIQIWIQDYKQPWQVSRLKIVSLERETILRLW